MKIGLLGHGVVGSGVTAITDSCARKKVRRLEVTRILVKDESELTDPRCTLNVEEILQDPEIELVAECMGGLEPAHTMVSRALEAGKHVVTSNKKMFANYCEELFELAQENGVTIRYEASVGGGIPWMSNLTRIKRLESVLSFRGILNGTTNYILTRMEETGRDFEECLAEAQKLGYAEKNPTDDIEGYDVMYKAAITAMKAFNATPALDAIPMYGIANVSSVDLAWAAEKNCSLKLLACGSDDGKSISLWVMPVFLKKEDILANVSGNFNAIECNSETLGKASFIGQGAGSLPTAHAVVQDMLDVYVGQDTALGEMESRTICNDNIHAQFYIRTENREFFRPVTREVLLSGAIITEVMPLSEIDRMIKESEDAALFAAMVYAE
ncbi:MAG: homoserine dehydrogenase [Solobacterium sp.]|nr:homoserine dehydrogenase [Solobacterium sp.]